MARRHGSLPASVDSSSEAPPSHSDHKCSVCLELFSEPKVLPCCHTFCLECLKKTATSGTTEGQITCPKCRKFHEIPEGGLSEFLTDFVENYEAEVVGLSSPKYAESVVCGECEQPGPVSHFCGDCQNYLCDECGLQVHKRLKTFRGHKVVPISEIDAATLQSCQVQYCSLHKGEVLKLYCETCQELVCRDCTLVEHRQHSYKFVQDARKQIEAEMKSLKSDVEKKVFALKLDLQEIKKVEAAVSGYPQVVKADINLYFDNLVRAIEARRRALLQEAEGVCQRDLKQVWADRNFHETTIAHISSVFNLVSKACKCTNDSEMMLTALQSIRQLRMIQEREWDGRAFIKMVSSAPSFKTKKAKKEVSVDAFGALVHVTSSQKEMQLSSTPKQANIQHNNFQVTIMCPPIQAVVDTRSGKTINLQKRHVFTELEVDVLYGQAKKKLNSGLITIKKLSQQQPYKAQSQLQPSYYAQQRPASQYYAHAATTAPVQSNSKSGACSQTYNVSMHFVCGGKHTAIFRYGNGEMTHSFAVCGEPRNGSQVKRGPDWGPHLEKQYQGRKVQGMPVGQLGNDGSSADGMIGTYMVNAYYHRAGESGMVTVTECSGGSFEYKWGKDGKYEIELCNAVSHGIIGIED